METKPFSLQAPEEIAKDYAGNKQKIAQAAQMGLLDPTAAVMAAMFIDRMRSAQVQEGQPQQTVAQEVFAPPAPPMGGLGGLPQGMAPMPPEAMAQGAPQLPPEIMEAMAQGAPAPEEEPMMAEGGLAGLEVPDDMFMETDNYAGGGMVAFQGGGLASTLMGNEDPYARFIPDEGLLARLSALMPQKTEAMDALMQAYGKMGTPEALKAARKQDMWAAIGQIAANLGKTPGPLIGAIGQSIGAALPSIAEAKKARKREEFEALKAQAEAEGISNNRARELAKLGIDLKSDAERLENEMARARLSADTTLQQARIYAGARKAAGDGDEGPLTRTGKMAAYNKAAAIAKLALAEAKKAEKSKDPAKVEAALKIFHEADADYRKYATQLDAAGSEGYPGYDPMQFKSLQMYANQYGMLPSGRGLFSKEGIRQAPGFGKKGAAKDDSEGADPLGLR